jgi:hypothetical protein
MIAFAGLMHTPDGAPICAVIMAYIGSVADGERALRPLREFGSPALDGVGPVAYTGLQTMLDGGFPFGLQNYWKSSFTRALTDDAIDTVIEAFGGVTSPLNIALFEQFGGAVRRVSAEATAFSHREAAYNLVVISRWEDPAEADRHIAWARGVWSAMQPFAMPEAYVNYLGADESDRVGEAYGPGYGRLAALKQKYDPSNFFRVNQNIIPVA